MQVRALTFRAKLISMTAAALHAEWVTHLRDERRFASMMFQGGADLKRRAWSAALATAGVR